MYPGVRATHTNHLGSHITIAHYQRVSSTGLESGTGGVETRVRRGRDRHVIASLTRVRAAGEVRGVPKTPH